MKRKSRNGATFRASKSSTEPLAIEPHAMSIFWLFGLGVDNETSGRVSVVTVDGPLEQRSCMWDGYDAILERFGAACDDPETTAIVLRLSSPGGEAAGCFEAVRMMRDRADAAGKRVVAFADESAYSAAYALACVGDEIYLPPSGSVGSVGVIAECVDVSAMNEAIGVNVEVVYAGDRKADCHPDMPLTNEAIAVVQKRVNDLAELFAELVASARGIAPAQVAALEAGIFMGDDAIAAGLADGVLGFDELLAMLNLGADVALDNKEIDDMKTKRTGTNAKPTPITDALASPTIAAINPDALAAAANLLTAGKPAPEPAAEGMPAAPVVVVEGMPDPGAYERQENHRVKETTEEADEETGRVTQTTKTTTTESTTKDPDDDGDDDSDEEGDDDDDDADKGDDKSDDKKGDKSSAAAAAAVVAPSLAAPLASSPRRTRTTSGDVLKAVRELTGSSSPGEQLGILTAMRDKAATVPALEAKIVELSGAKSATELASVVDGAIRAGTLAPAKREWAMSQSLETIRGYLKGAEPLVRTSPIAQRPEKGAKGREQSHATGDGVVDDAIANVARTMQMDPKQIAAHAADLKKQGVIH